VSKETPLFHLSQWHSLFFENPLYLIISPLFPIPFFKKDLFIPGRMVHVLLCLQKSIADSALNHALSMIMVKSSAMPPWG
jgi:hypothetical protein